MLVIMSNEFMFNLVNHWLIWFFKIIFFYSTDNDSPTMTEAIKMITKAYDLCFSNKFLQAKADIEPCYGNFNL